MSFIHKELAQGGWQKLSLVEQMANIGSEIERAISWHKKNNQEYARKAIDRALELFDLTINDERWIHRLREIARLREVVCDVFCGDNVYRTSFDALQKYFLSFAFAARRLSQ